MEEALELVAAQAQAKGLELVYEFDPKIRHRFVGDASRLRQVLANLLSNAVKFTEAGEVVPVVVQLSEREMADGQHEVEVEVRDTGIGMTPSSSAACSRPFTQADASTTRRFGGTGLGLAISKRLVEAMGGRSGRRASRAGLDVLLHVPRSGSSVRAGRAAARRPELRGLRMLVVDDNATNRKILRALSESWGMTVWDSVSDERARASARGSVVPARAARLQHARDGRPLAGAEIRNRRRRECDHPGPQLGRDAELGAEVAASISRARSASRSGSLSSTTRC